MPPSVAPQMMAPHTAAQPSSLVPTWLSRHPNRLHSMNSVALRQDWLKRMALLFACLLCGESRRKIRWFVVA